MKLFLIAVFTVLSVTNTVEARENNPVTFHLSYDTMDFLSQDFVHNVGRVTPDDRGLELIDGKFGKALKYSLSPRFNNDLSGSDLDMISTLVVDSFMYGGTNLINKQPFFEGAGILHPAEGAVSFWVSGKADSASVFQLSTTAWGRTEKELIELVLHDDISIRAYVEDARYVRHTIKTKPVWREDTWNHVVLMWDKSSGLELWFNGKKAASSMGADAWWENQRPGYFHLGMPLASYDELYCFSRTLSPAEISGLYRSNKPPTAQTAGIARGDDTSKRLKTAYMTDTSSLPVARPFDGFTTLFHDITAERVHDEGINGWWVADGRFECAWPHEYTIFTRIPGDVDYVAEKVEMLPPEGADINYMTFEGNLDGVSVFRGDRDGNFESTPVASVPATDGFFYGMTPDGLGDSEILIPFAKEIGVPTKFFNSDVLKLPLTGDLRIHEIGLYNVSGKSLQLQPGDKRLTILPPPQGFPDDRYESVMTKLLPASDRNVTGMFDTGATGLAHSEVLLKPMAKMNLISEPAVWKSAYDHIILDLWLSSPVDDNVLAVKVLNPGVLSQTWTHAEVRLDGFGESPSRLRLALKFDPVCLVPGNSLWIQLLSTDGLKIHTGNQSNLSQIILRPVQDRIAAETIYSRKTMTPAILTWGRMFEFIPWERGKAVFAMPDVDEPTQFGGPYDTTYPWQAVLKVNPGDRIANFYRSYSTMEYPYGRQPADLKAVRARKFAAPDNAPDWAVHFRQVQTFRNRIMSWWMYHQRSDGQFGGGWNDDTLLFGKGTQGYGDLPLDSNAEALHLYNTMFDGLDKMGYYKDGYCHVWPIDQGHNGDLIRDRFKSLIYNLGDPRYAVWAMEAAWHWDKPDQTPANYGDGSAFLFGLAAMEWYWNKRPVAEPYVADREKLMDTLRTAAFVHNDTTFWRYSDSWNHIDDQRPYGGSEILDILTGRLGMTSYRVPSRDTGAIQIGVGWIDGGGPELARFVEHSGNDALKISMYSFDSLDRDVTMRIYRLASGTYRVTLRADMDGDDCYEKSISEIDIGIQRFDSHTLTIPPEIRCQLEFRQLEADTVPENRPDLAISEYYVTRNGGTVIADVHNIGTAPSGKFTLSVLDAQGRVIKEMSVESIEGSGDFVPKHREITVKGLPEDGDLYILIDRENAVAEIYEGNNRSRSRGRGRGIAPF